MLRRNHDCTILLEETPEVECIGGLFYITDRFGEMVIRRCLRPHTYLATVHKCKKLADEWLAQQNKVAEFPH